VETELQLARTYGLTLEEVRHLIKEHKGVELEAPAGRLKVGESEYVELSNPLADRHGR
jgi:hypothetical protein